MKLKKQILFKIALGAVLLALASGLTILIKDMLALRNPESALPVLTVYQDGERLNERRVRLAAYDWRFLYFTSAADSIPDEEWMSDDSLEFVPLLPGTKIDLVFSYDCRDVKVSVAEGGVRFYTLEDFSEMPETNSLELAQTQSMVLYNDTSFYLPMEQGGYYTIKVEADWGYRGSVLYYFRVNIPAEPTD